PTPTKIKTHIRRVEPSISALSRDRELDEDEPYFPPIQPTPVYKTALVIAPAKRSKSETTVFEAMADDALPPLNFLDPPDNNLFHGFSNQQLEAISRDVELRLQDFGIQVKVVAVHPGPVVTRFELQLAAGTKVSRITALAKDLARSLSVISVRVVEIIPG